MMATQKAAQRAMMVKAATIAAASPIACLLRAVLGDDGHSHVSPHMIHATKEATSHVNMKNAPVKS
jgi:hypothetical protein